MASMPDDNTEYFEALTSPVPSEPPTSNGSHSMKSRNDYQSCPTCDTRWFANEVLPCPKCGDASAERLSAMVDSDFRRMCENLRTCTEKYKLGLGGEHLDELVIAALAESESQRQLLEQALRDLLKLDDACYYLGYDDLKTEFCRDCDYQQYPNKQPQHKAGCRVGEAESALKQP